MAAGKSNSGDGHEAARSWRTRPAAQQPHWPDPRELERVTAGLAVRPPLVSADACDRLRQRLARVARGEATLLQGGDCAETFAPGTAGSIRRTATTLLRMAAVLGRASGLPVVTVGRMAGQYAKPRSSPVERRDGVTLPSYRGDAVNGRHFGERARRPDPARLRTMYEESARTLDVLRSLAAEGAPDVPGPEFYVSHEALLLDYEAALLRTDPATGRVHSGGGHLLWIGERTRQLDGAHVEFCSRISNPVAVKLGPNATSDEMLGLMDRLDPGREPGRLTFVVRAGARRVRDVLPALVEKANAEGSAVCWVSDPMHGNTVTAPSGHKTRHVADVLDEVRGFVEVHRALGTHPGGVHLELTGDDVTECLGAGGPLFAEELTQRYETACDPRLNRAQALGLADRLADSYRRS
ncbi:3-deoxy-7-phosphoheptulonate synthase class II [Streptomyces sp. NPDC006645]|uniref:3-deoxy-7-phosphoheptulonate synthase class II n=1 Tax=unclassified Streptomyces TaxID=2593676 RepID=UPI0033BEF3CC